jgi:hypothetical protein
MFEQHNLALRAEDQNDPGGSIVKPMLVAASLLAL